MRPHLSLNVRDVSRSIHFYTRVFGKEPQKQTSDYAKFDLQSPPLNFSLQSKEPLSQVSHLGIEVESLEEFDKWQKHLEKTSIVTTPELNTNCCYARQDKLWFEDPDGNPWEIFYVHEQLPVTSQSSTEALCCAG